MKRLFILFGLITLTACNDDSGAGVGPPGVGLEELGGYGVDCLHPRLVGLLEVQDGLCVPAAPYLKTLVRDCEIVAQAGCHGSSDSCAVAAVITLVAEAYGAYPEEIGADCASPENPFLLSIEWLLYFGTIDNRPVVGDQSIPWQWLAEDECVIGIYDQLSPLAQWIYRPDQPAE